MSYSYNPHSHVKIWLTLNPNEFMNLENQTRLIEMREKNSSDTIHFIYDSSLLNDPALDALSKFCEDNNIIPVDASTFGEHLQSENEKKLYEFYKDEITHLNTGGNLAVASDILRWLPPTYLRGTYTDFDFPIDTTALPMSIPVEAPLLLNIGSLRLGNKEMIVANNDYVAVVDEAAARKEINRVQSGIISILTKYDTDFIEKTERALGGESYLNYTRMNYMKNRVEVIYFQKSKAINKSIGELSSRKLRAYINEVMTDKSKFLDFNKKTANESPSSVVKRLRGELQKQLGIVKWMFFTKEYYEIKNILSQNDDQFISFLMRKERSLYLKSIVVCTTGPVAIANALFDGSVLNTKEFKRYARPISFNQYDLQNAFQSKNSIPMHENILGMIRFLGKETGELNDSSWLEEGRKLQALRQEKIVIRHQNLQLSLPSDFLAIKIDIQKHIKILLENSIGFWGNFFQSRKNAKIIALKQVLACFHQDKQEFDINQFKSALTNMHSKKNIFAGFFSSRTKKLIESVAQLSHDAVVCRLAKDKKVAVGDERSKQPNTQPVATKAPHRNIFLERVEANSKPIHFFTAKKMDLRTDAPSTPHVGQESRLAM